MNFSTANTKFEKSLWESALKVKGLEVVRKQLLIMKNKLLVRQLQRMMFEFGIFVL